MPIIFMPIINNLDSVRDQTENVGMIDWEADKLIGVVVSLVGGALTIGEKLCKWGKSAYQSLKKIQNVSFETKLLKKIRDVELKDSVPTLPIDVDLRTICIICPPIFNCIQRHGRTNRF